VENAQVFGDIRLTIPSQGRQFACAELAFLERIQDGKPSLVCYSAQNVHVFDITGELYIRIVRSAGMLRLGYYNRCKKTGAKSQNKRRIIYSNFDRIRRSKRGAKR